MDKQKIVEFINEYIGQFDERLHVRGGVDLHLDIDLDSKIVTLATFPGFKTNEFIIFGLDGAFLFTQNELLNEISRLIMTKDIFMRFYYRALDAFEEFSNKKSQYTISLSKDSTTNYLNIDKTTGGFFFSTNDDTDKVQAYFTETEIESMKDDPRFEAINFEKAIIEEVEGRK